MQNIRSNPSHKYIYATYLIAPRIIAFPLMILLFIICYFLLLFPLPSPYSGVDFVLHGTIHYSAIRYSPLQQFQSGCGWDEPHFLIYMLSSRTWWSESIDLQFRRKNRNRFGPLHDRRHRNRGKRGVTTTVFIKGRNAHETMNSIALLWKIVTTPTHVLSKIPIHFEEHGSPVTRIFTSRTSMKF